MKVFKNSLFVLSVWLLIGCGGEKKQSGIPVVDVTKTYPKKEIKLQDIADVEYIPLETRDDVLIDNHYQVCTISPDSLLVGNYEEGSIFLFDSKGKVLQKFNRKGQSGTEYKEIWGLSFDRKAQEVFVFDYPYKYRFQVYDTKGNFKRTISLDKKYSFSNTEILNYDDTALLCYNKGNIFSLKTEEDSSNEIVTPFVFISKKDGKELGVLPISFPQKARVTSSVVKKYSNGSIGVNTTNLQSITVDKQQFILSEISKDTIYLYSQAKTLEPMVVRSPKVVATDDPISFLQIKKVTPNYLFGTITRKQSKKKPHFSFRDISIDRKTNEVSECKITDATGMKLPFYFSNDNSILLNTGNLNELLEEGKLKGKLKEIAENLNEDDNPVWVKIQFKE